MVMREDVKKLGAWVEANNTHGYLQEVISMYIRHRGRVKFANLSVSNRHHCLAAKQDKTCWVKFMEGRFTKRIKDLQTHKMLRSKYGTKDTWKKGLLEKSSTYPTTSGP